MEEKKRGERKKEEEKKGEFIWRTYDKDKTDEPFVYTSISTREIMNQKNSDYDFVCGGGRKKKHMMFFLGEIL